jgi:26S proteasome regulatory subunit T4
MTISAPAPLNPREKGLEDYRKQLKIHKELSSKLKQMNEEAKVLCKDYDKSENDLKALQSVGQV